MSDPDLTKPGFLLAVAGAKDAPPALVVATLDDMTARVRSTCRLSVASDGGVTEWANKHGYPIQYNGACPPLYGRFAWARFELQLVAHASALVVFIDESRPWKWRRLLALAGSVGLPYRTKPYRIEEGGPGDAAPVPSSVSQPTTWGDYFPSGVPTRAG